MPRRDDGTPVERHAAWYKVLPAADDIFGKRGGGGPPKPCFAAGHIERLIEGPRSVLW